MGFTGWMGDGRMLLSVRDDTARFLGGGVDTGRAPVALEETPGAIAGQIAAGGVVVTFTMPTVAGQRGTIHAAGIVSGMATAPVNVTAANARDGGWKWLRADIETLIAAWPGRAAVGIRDLSRRDGGVLLAGDPGQIRTASTNKIAALIALMRRVDAGLESLDRSVWVTINDWPSGGSDLREDNLLPGWFTVGDLADRMIRRSDNTATNMICTIVGRDRIRAVLDGQNLTGFWFPDSAYAPGAEEGIWAGDHWTDTYAGYMEKSRATAADMLDMLSALWNGGSLTGPYRQEAINIMYRTTDSSRLRGGGPDGMPLAHKTGALSGFNVTLPAVWEGYTDLPGISNDAGIVTIAGREYAIVVLAEGDTADGSALIRAVSTVAFAHFMGVTRDIKAVSYKTGGVAKRVTAAALGGTFARVPGI